MKELPKDRAPIALGTKRTRQSCRVDLGMRLVWIGIDHWLLLFHVRVLFAHQVLEFVGVVGPGVLLEGRRAAPIHLDAAATYVAGGVPRLFLGHIEWMVLGKHVKELPIH